MRLTVGQLPIKAGWWHASSCSRILPISINTMHQYRTVEWRRKYITLTRPITTIISTGNLKTVLFLLPWPILTWTDCRTPNFGTLLILRLFQLTQWKQKVITSNRLCHCTSGNLLLSPESSSFSYLIRVIPLYITNFFVRIYYLTTKNNPFLLPLLRISLCLFTFLVLHDGEIVEFKFFCLN